MKRILLTLAVVTVIVPGCCLAKGKAQPAAPAGWTLVWSDEFDYEGLPDPARWNFDTRGNASGWGNREAQYYTESDTRNALVRDGKLHITARLDSMGGKRYTSARLTTRGKGDWLYGRVEVSAKLPGGRGAWPAIWMMPTGSAYGRWPASGEIDIMENVGFDPDTVLATAHTARYNHVARTSSSSRYYLPTARSEFHVYSVEWEPGEWRAYVDGNHYYTFKDDGGGFESWPFDHPFHLILNVAVGGNWGGRKGIDDELFPKTMEVDYVRVYQRAP